MRYNNYSDMNNCFSFLLLVEKMFYWEIKHKTVHPYTYVITYTEEKRKSNENKEHKNILGLVKGNDIVHNTQ